MGGQPWGAVRPGPPKAPRRVGKIVAVVLVAFALVSAAAIVGVVVLARNSPYPSSWDPRVADLAGFVERERKLEFKDPVYVDFMSEDDFKKRVSVPTGNQTEEDRQELQREVELFRAIGLLQGDVNLLEQTNQLRQGGTLALYDSKTKRVHVRGTELDVARRVTIVHELTHALQDQHFELQQLTKLPTDDQRTAFRTVIEGDAVRIEKKYIEQLPEASRTAFRDQEKKDSDEAKKDVSSVPDVLVASFSAPYAFGTPFLDVLEAKGGTAEVNNALRAPPNGPGQIIDPEDYFQKRSITEVRAPAVPAGAEKVPSGAGGGQAEDVDRLGVLDFFLMLSARVDPHQALKAADVWNGDAMVAYREGGRVCAKVGVATDDGAGDTMAPILDEWKRDMAPEANATVDRSGDRFEITTCDPGAQADAKIEGTPSDVFSLPAVRLYVLASALASDVAPDRANCIARTFIDTLSVQEARSETADTDKLRARFADAKAACP